MAKNLAGTKLHEWPVTLHSDLDRTSKLAVDRNYLAHGNTLLDRREGEEKRGRETLRSIDGGATYGFVPDSARFCFVAVFRPATGVQTPHTEMHTAPRPFFLPLSVTVCPSTGRSRYFHPSNRTCDEAPVIVTKKPILSPIPRRIPNSPCPNLASRLSKLETLEISTDRVRDIQFFDSPRLEC